MAVTALALADGDGPRHALLWRLAAGMLVTADRRRVREEVAGQILAQMQACPEHPMPLPRPSCWQCARNGAFHRAALIAAGKFGVQ